MKKVRFVPKLWPTLGTLCLMALFVHLGQWQQGKADLRFSEITQRNERSQHGPFLITGAIVDPEAMQAAPVAVRGEYEPEHQIFIDNRQENGVPGVHVVTPLKIEGSQIRVLVNRGWTAWTNGRSTLPTVPAPQGTVLVAGLAEVPSAKKFFLMPDHGDALPRLWSRLDLVRFAAERNETIQPVVILQAQGDATDALVRNWKPPEDRSAMHQSYAYQWFGMALALIIFYAVASLQRNKEHEQTST